MTDEIHPNKSCLLLRLGVTDYPEAQELQRDVARRRGEGTLPDALLLLQHPHTYTLGRRAGQSDVLLESDALEEIGARVYSVDRGGEATYHGPGQIVGYPVVDVRLMGGATGYVRTLETLLIAALEDFGIAAQRRDGLPGSWVDNEKIALHRRQDRPGHHHARLRAQREPGPLLLPAHSALRDGGHGRYVHGARLGQAHSP